MEIAELAGTKDPATIQALRDRHAAAGGGKSITEWLPDAIKNDPIVKRLASPVRPGAPKGPGHVDPNAAGGSENKGAKGDLTLEDIDNMPLRGKGGLRENTRAAVKAIMKAPLSDLVSRFGSAR